MFPYGETHPCVSLPGRHREGGLHGAVLKRICPVSAPAQEGRDDERALDELRALVQRGFRPVPLVVRGKMMTVCQRFSSSVGPGAIDPNGPGAGWAGVDCAPRNVGSLPGDINTSQPADAGGTPKVAQSMAPHKLAASEHFKA